MMDSWTDVAKYGQSHTKSETILQYESFFRGLKNPHRKLNTIIARYDAKLSEFLPNKGREPPYGVEIDTQLKEKVLLHLSKHNNVIRKEVTRSLLVDLLRQHKKTHLLREFGGKYVFDIDWATRALARWKVMNNNNMQSHEENAVVIAAELTVQNDAEEQNVMHAAVTNDIKSESWLLYLMWGVLLLNLVLFLLWMSR
jgi:hypothetical protein